MLLSCHSSLKKLLFSQAKCQNTEAKSVLIEHEDSSLLLVHFWCQEWRHCLSNFMHRERQIDIQQNITPLPPPVPSMLSSSPSHCLHLILLLFQSSAFGSIPTCSLMKPVCSQSSTTMGFGSFNVPYIRRCLHDALKHLYNVYFNPSTTITIVTIPMSCRKFLLISWWI